MLRGKKRKGKEKKFSLATLAPLHLPARCLCSPCQVGLFYGWVTGHPQSRPCAQTQQTDLGKGRDVAEAARTSEQQDLRHPSRLLSPAHAAGPGGEPNSGGHFLHLLTEKTNAEGEDWQQCDLIFTCCAGLCVFIVPFFLFFFFTTNKVIYSTLAATNCSFNSKMFDWWTDLCSSSQQVANDDTARNPLILDCALLLG